MNFNIGPLTCSGKSGHYPSEAKTLQKEKLNFRLNELTTDLKETKADLNKLSDQTAKVKNQNLISKTMVNALNHDLEETKIDLNEFTNRTDLDKQYTNLKITQLTDDIKELKKNLDRLSYQADEVKKQNLNIRLKEFKNELDEMKAGLNQLRDQAEEVEKQNFSTRLNALKAEIKITKEDLEELADQAVEVAKQNLNTKIHNLTNEIAETKMDLNELIVRADETEKQNLTSKIQDLSSDIKKTKEHLDKLSNHLDDHRKIMSIHGGTPFFEKIGPFRASKSNKIGEITKYYKNFEFSMEFKYQSLNTSSYRQIIREMVTSIIFFSFTEKLNNFLII